MIIKYCRACIFNSISILRVEPGILKTETKKCLRRLLLASTGQGAILLQTSSDGFASVYGDITESDVISKDSSDIWDRCHSPECSGKMVWVPWMRSSMSLTSGGTGKVFLSLVVINIFTLVLKMWFKKNDFLSRGLPYKVVIYISLNISQHSPFTLLPITGFVLPDLCAPCW